jgi:hypothetical protein
MDINNVGEKRKRRSISGWVAAIIGGLFTLLGLLILVVAIYDIQPDLYPHLLLGVPCFLLGIPLLILGIRRIKNADVNEEQNIVAVAQSNKNQQRWGLVLTFFGGVITLFGIYNLLVSVLTGYTTDWYKNILICSVPSFLLGIPLLILGMRRIKNVPDAEQVNWGWAAAIIGFFLTLYSLSYFLLGIFTDISAKSASLACGAPSLLFGIPLIILGIRKIVKERASERFNPENIEANKRKRRIWGWVLVVIGALIILCGIGFLFFAFYVFFILSPLKGYGGPYEGSLTDSFIMELVTIGIPLTIIGVTLVIPGYLTLRKNAISRRSRGWLFVIMGGLYWFATLMSIGYNVNILNEQMAIMAFYLPLFIILGILGLVFGIRDLTGKGNMPPVKITGSDIQKIELDNKSSE